MTAPLPEDLQQVADYIKAEQFHLAQPLLVQYIKQQPDSADAWYLMSFVVADQRRQIDCLQRVLRFNPAHRQAQARLVEVMTEQSSASFQPAAPVFTHTMASVRHDEEVRRDEGARLDRDEIARHDEPASSATLQPQPLPAPIEPEPEPLPPEPPEFTNLRSQLAKPVKERRKPRRSYRSLLFLLVFIVLVAAAGTAVVVFSRLRDESAAANAAAALAAPPTATPTTTPTPTSTPRRFPPTWTPTALPTALPTRTPTPPPTADAAQDAQLRPVQQAVAALRGLPAANLSTRYIIQPDQVESVLQNILNGAGLLSALPDRARVLSALGLIKPAYNLERYMLNTHLDPAGGFYSPWTREIFVVANQAAGVQSWAFALEAARALLDQSFEFASTEAYPVCTLSTQQCQAVRALIAGDAALTVQYWLRQSASAQDRSEVQSFKTPALSLADDFAPVFVTRDVHFAAEAGTAFAQYLFQRGSWARLDAAQTDPPQSTEQIMHPEKYLADEQPIELAAVPLTTTLGPAWQLIADDVLGEWHTYLLLSANADEPLRVPDEAARSAARGWGGDRLQAYYHAATAETLLAVAWTWDTTADAREFKQALAAHLDRRFDGAARSVPQANGDCWQTDQQAACLYTRDKNTLWLLAPDQPLIEAITAAYAPFP
jgi:hypothetical protein